MKALDAGDVSPCFRLQKTKCRQWCSAENTPPPDSQPHQKSASLNKPMIILHLLRGPAVSLFCTSGFCLPLIQLCHMGLWSCCRQCVVCDSSVVLGLELLLSIPWMLEQPWQLICFPLCAPVPAQPVAIPWRNKSMERP